MIEPSAPPATDWQDAVRPTRRIGRAIEAHASIGSTNDRARALLEEGDADGVVVVADEQVTGRGRRGRGWISPPGLNLMASVATRPSIRAADAWQLALAAGLAARDACGDLPGIGLKWPNDLVTDDGLKLGGLLIETMVDGDRLAGAVIGVGINVNWRRAEMPAELRGSSGSLAELAGRPVDRVALLGRLLEAFEDELARVEAGESPLERYGAACVTLGRRVVIATVDGRIEGLAAALDASGELVVEAGGARHVLASGEVVRVRQDPAP